MREYITDFFEIIHIGIDKVQIYIFAHIEQKDIYVNVENGILTAIERA